MKTKFTTNIKDENPYKDLPVWGDIHIGSWFITTTQYEDGYPIRYKQAHNMQLTFHKSGLISYIDMSIYPPDDILFTIRLIVLSEVELILNAIKPRLPK